MHLLGKKYSFAFFAIALIIGCQGIDSDKVKVPDIVDFNFHVKPLLSDRCFACHGPDENTREAGLRFDTEEGAFAALDTALSRYAIVSGDVDSSELVARIFSEDEQEMMPPPSSNLSLSDYEKEILRKWIQQGAEWKEHWSFITPVKGPLPTVSDGNWPINDIDFFTLARMEENGLRPNPEADPRLLIKRLAYDLTGLPPSLDLQQRFVEDQSDDAYEKVVDKLLDSKHYGERMAVHWLDVARYADSHGYQDDGPRSMWPWRDWVIHAFNENYPYDQFLKWQLAGDMIPDTTKETILATGFNRNHKITQEGGVIDEEYRIEYVTDRTNTFGKAFLGLTFECAKCHDHKYDPISREEYFSTFAFFDRVPEKGLFGIIGANSYADPPNMEITNEDVNGILSFVNKQDTALLQVMVMKDSVGIRETRMLERGNYDSPRDTVYPDLPAEIFPFDTSKYPGNRLGLTQWLLDDDHPLTSRVFVNRMWQEIFGRGFVKTSGDFGLQGELPSHPELLDWLAVDFREHGWDIKRLVKQMVMSATYRQSAKISDLQIKRDPENLFLSRSSRFRLGAEAVRDMVLATSGLLNDEIGGPSIKPYQDGDIWGVASPGRGLLMNYVQDRGSKLYRRGMYVFIKRTNPPPTMLMFDASNRDQCEVRRLRTNTPLQALAMLNDPHVIEAARVYAQHLLSQFDELEQQVDHAFQTIICRPIKDDEMELLVSYYHEEKDVFEQNPGLAQEILNVGEYPREPDIAATDIAALMQVVHTIFNMEEAITRS